MRNGAVDMSALRRDLMATGAAVSDDAAATFAVDGRAPQCVVFPESVAQLSQCLAATARAGAAVIPAGNGTQLTTGGVPSRYDVAVSTRHLRRIVAHEAADMTVTVEAGATLAELNEALAATRQRLPLDPPHPARRTLGGVIAADACGPWRLSQGKVRDLLIGITVVLADGTIVHGGGRVVKNVAGYDLMKLFTGSYGTLGVIAEATFKVRPLPAREEVLCIPAQSGETAVTVALEVRAAPLAPQYVSAVNETAAQAIGLERAAVLVGCAGDAEEVNVQRARANAVTGGIQLCGETEGARLYSALRDWPAANDTCGGCRISVVPTQLAGVLGRIAREAVRHHLGAAIVAHVGNGVAVVRFIGAPAGNALVALARWTRAQVRALGGWVVFDRLPAALKSEIDPWGTEAPGLALMRGIKQTLDPHGRLSPGRFVGGI